jgi:phage tail sheath gpL-like
MAYGTLHLQNKWFAEASPTNPHKATATLTFDGIPVVTETVTIGTEVYEFVAAAGDIADPANIPVALGTTLTADNAVTKLTDAINANSELVTAVKNTTDDTVVVTYKNIGTAGNDIEIAETCTNASWGVDVTKLSGGSFGTPSMTRNVIVYVSPYYYWCETEGSEYTVSWKRFTPATY